LGQAAALIEEAEIPEYAHHIVYAWGHLAEAALECPDRAFAMEIRDRRKMNMLHRTLIPIDDLIKKAFELLQKAAE
jgi:hypothetical protein